jgi:general transcription factor 3C polypeptide 6
MDVFPPKTLIPGYAHVDTFGPDEEYESGEEEVEYVTLDLGVVEPTLVPSSSTYRLIVSLVPIETE